MEERLHKFARLVEAGSFTKAAAELHISQPALSVAIAKLERELHSPLLVRGTRTMQLTEAGRLAYAAAKELRTTTGNLGVKLAEIARKELAVSIGMIDSVASSLFSSDSSLTDLERQAHISIVVNNSRHLLETVIRDQLDVAFIVQQSNILPAGVEMQAIGNEPLVVVCHASQQKSMQYALQEGALPRFISYDQPSTSHGIILSSLERQGITPMTTFYSTSPDVMLRLVLLQKGAAALPYLLVKELLAEGTLSLLRANSPLLIDRPIQRITGKGKTMPMPLKQITSQVRNSLRQLSQEARHYK